MQVVGNEILKGVWNSRYVPIIWYHPDIHTPDVIFPYDEKIRNQLVNNLIKTNEPINQDYLAKIAFDLGLKDKWKETLDRLNCPKGLIPTSTPKERQAEVHVAVICISEQDKVLCVQRVNTKNRLPGKWEFGCIQLFRSELQLKNIIEAGYQKKKRPRFCSVDWL